MRPLKITRRSGTNATDDYKPIFTPEHSPVSNPANLFENSTVRCQFFANRFGTLPSRMEISRVDAQKAITWFEKTCSSIIQKRHFRKTYDRGSKKYYYFDVLYVLHTSMMLLIELTSITLYCDARDEDAAQQLLDQFIPFIVKPKQESAIHLVVSSNGGLDAKKVAFRAPRVTLEAQYNDDLLPLHQDWLRMIRNPATSGLFLFHGCPGTGKSTYIQHLIGRQKRDVLFFTPQLASQMAGPQFTELLLQNQHAIVVIEDAEELLVARDHTRNSAISMLLNLTDGILGNSLGILFICTFNTEISRLDQALLRKGRLKGSYEFRPLAQAKSQALLHQLHGPEATATGPMTLADIYNWQAPATTMIPTRAAIGFSAAR